MKAVYLAIEKLMLRATSDFVGFADKDGEPFWSTGALEYWSVGKSQDQNFDQNNHYSITPQLHYSSRLPHEG